MGVPLAEVTLAVTVTDCPALTVDSEGVRLVVVPRSEDFRTVKVDPAETGLAA